MNDNNISVDIELQNEELENPIYSSTFLMDKELYYDFCSINYNRTKKLFLTFLCLVFWFTTISILDGGYDVVLSFSLFIPIILVALYFRANKLTKISYERTVISTGKEENTINCEIFEDEIVSHIDETQKKFFYHQVTNLYETKNFILLHLKHNLFITINKKDLNGEVDALKSFLVEKCVNVKNKKFINCANVKKQSLIFLIALITVSIIGILIAFVLKFKSIL